MGEIFASCWGVSQRRCRAARVLTNRSSFVLICSRVVLVASGQNSTVAVAREGRRASSVDFCASFFPMFVVVRRAWLVRASGTPGQTGHNMPGGHVLRLCRFFAIFRLFKFFLSVSRPRCAWWRKTTFFAVFLAFSPNRPRDVLFDSFRPVRCRAASCASSA